ncbi:CHAP domain-containing protein [Aggregatilineales bacterium SYSU G02658]
MSELEARLTSLQNGAEQLRRSAERVDLSVQAALREIDSLLLTGYESPTVYLLLDELTRRRAAVSGLGAGLRQMGEALQTAHDEIAAAVGDGHVDAVAVVGGALPAAITTTRSHILPPSRRAQRLARMLAAAPTAPAPEMAAPTGIAWAVSVPFVAAVNRTLHEDWNAARHKLQTSHSLRDALLSERDQQQTELNALSNRILAADPQARLEAIPQVAELQGRIADLDAQIDHLNAQITATEAEFNALHERFQRVMPGAAADVPLIARMEHGQTAQAVLDNTQDCVHYVASRMAIPPGMATNAHLWNDNVARLAQYGLQVGDVPLEGSVLVMERDHPYAHSVYGHVMYVERVDARGVWVTDNQHPEPVLLSSLTSETQAHISYVYFPWQTKA